ncbi:hypothetical protein [Pleionea litopenaei]|uniref:Uncharacterized protein n=1 Tax=Pleionea litopenaei TaxID=3070815 RepID=A0AA51X5Y0_9GAMM|nr:hypothetical protein [Pleionea sp. HL-JVS1]WMS86543.1 hypothetical protein Q9312_15085 [Pleionea sp. HL-JVS1]
MASWIEKPCIDLLKKLNDIPLDDKRESRQLTILMNGLAEINKEMMRRAAESVRMQIGGEASSPEPVTKPKATTEPAAESKKVMNDVPDLDDFDSFDEELDMIEQTLIRSISD